LTDAVSHLLERLAGKWIAQAISTAARLGLAEALREPMSVEALAKATQCDASALARLVAVLVGEGVLAQDEHGMLSLTPVGELLRRDELGALAAFVGSPSQWVPWAELEHAMRTGENAFERVHGQPMFEYLATRPEEARLYDEAIDAFTGQQGRALAESDLLDGVHTVVDVGGGRGTLLREVLVRRPSLRGVLFDRDHVVEAARERFVAAGLSDRCAFVSGDFFVDVPAGGDAYVLKHVLHNWDDAQAIDLLRRCASAMAPGGRVLVVESVLLPGSRRDEARFLDLEMLVVTGGGKERSKPELRRLLTASGLKLIATRRLAAQAWLLVAA
jgi:ubiquinone/menaquinone biosynthesis C-methylase UbiE